MPPRVGAEAVMLDALHLERVRQERGEGIDGSEEPRQ